MRVIHAEVQPLFAEGLRSLLENSNFSNNFRHVSCSEVLKNALLAFDADLLFIDYSKEKEFSQLDIAMIVQNFPKVKIIVISNDTDPSRIINVLDLGVHGYLTKENSKEEICNAIRNVMSGGKYYCSHIINILVNKKNVKESIHFKEDDLTKRERDIIKYIAGGNTNRQIGKLLSISHHTVHTHRKNAMRKLGVNSSAELTLYAVNNNLLMLP